MQTHCYTPSIITSLWTGSSFRERRLNIVGGGKRESGGNGSPFPLPFSYSDSRTHWMTNASVNSTCAQPLPPPPGNRGAFASLVSPGGGALANLARPGGRALANPGGTPGLLTSTWLTLKRARHGEFPRYRSAVCGGLAFPAKARKTCRRY